MTQTRPHVPFSLGLAKGEWVTVRSRDEILATLDDQGKLDGLPFMPEMLEYCGRRLYVGRSAHKTCDTIRTYVNRRMHDAVHLDGVNCSGSGHDGCGALCPIFWKEAWLRRDPDTASGFARQFRSVLLRRRRTAAQTHHGCTLEQVTASALLRHADGSVKYSCQATQLREATSQIPRLDPRPYLHDLLSGNVSGLQMLRGGFFAFLRWTFGIGPGRRVKQTVYAWLQRCLNGPPIAGEFGTLEKTPAATLDLHPGEWIRVKPYVEIVKTLNRSQRNRGMWFDNEMLPYCGERHQVLARVDRLIDEKTGLMLLIKNDCIVLRDVICRGECSAGRMFCPRRLYPFWREIWLERCAPPPSSIESPMSGQLVNHAGASRTPPGQLTRTWSPASTVRALDAGPDP